MIVTAENITDLIGCEFTIKGTNKKYKISDRIISKKYLFIDRIDGKRHLYLNIDDLCLEINSDNFILDKTFLRKKKLEKLMNLV